MCASQWAGCEPHRRNESERPARPARGGIRPPGGRRTTGPSRPAPFREAEPERTRWDPKDGELCPSRVKPEETLVEVRSDSDVQIDRLTWV